MQIRVKKISGSDGSSNEKFSFINNKTRETVCGPCSIQELQVYLETHEKNEAKRRELRHKLNRDIPTARRIYNENISDFAVDINAGSTPKKMK